MTLRRRIAAAVLAGGATLAVSGTANAAVDRDCTDFATHAEAQAAYDAVPGDPERLDQDGDGVPCENLLGGTEGPPVTASPGATVTATPSATVTATPSATVGATPSGGVATGYGSSAGNDTGSLPLAGGLVLLLAGGAALAARRARGSG
jgi:Excalibur calcium-binding domain